MVHGGGFDRDSRGLIWGNSNTFFVVHGGGFDRDSRGLIWGNSNTFCVVHGGGFDRDSIVTIQEMATIAQEETPVKIIILNNGFLGMVRQWQQMFFEKRYSFVKLKNPDFVMLSKGFGIKAERVEKRESLGKALDRLLSAKTAYFLDITVLMEGNVFPMIPTGAAVDEIRLE